MEDDEIIRNLNQTNDNNDNDIFKNNKKKQQQSIITTKDLPTNFKDSDNWLAYNYFLRFDFDKSMEVLSRYNTKGSIETEFSIYTKALIKRHHGEIEKAIEMLKKCLTYNPNEIFTLKEIGKSLVLTGKFALSIDIYDEVLEKYPKDWETYHYKGIASMNEKSYETAQICFEKALSLNYNEAT